MATAVLGLLGHTEIDDADANTDWTTLTTADPDIKKEGLNAMSGILRSDLDTGYVSKAAAISCAGEHLRLWINTINVPYMETTVNGGYEIYVSDGVNTDYITIFSSDDYTGGWFNAVVDCALFTTVTPANVDTWGLRANHHTNGKNAINTWVDFFRYSDGYYVTGGTLGDELDLALIAARDADDGAGTLRGYGITAEKDGVFFGNGKINLGNSTTTTYFLMDGEVLAFVDNPVADNFYEFSAAGTVADITIKDSTILAAGITDSTRFVFDMSAANVLDMAGTVLNRAAAVTFATGQDVLGCTFNDCGQITPDGADLTGSVVKNYEGTINTSALVYNNSADPDGELDGMTFEKGTAATHAIEFGLLSPLTITLRNVACTDYNAADTQNDSTFHFKRTSGTVTLNLIGFTGNYTYRTDGATIDIIVDPVDIEITVLNDDTGLAIGTTCRVRVMLESNKNELMSKACDVSGVASESYSDSVPVDIVGWAREFNISAPDFVSQDFSGQITAAGFYLTVRLKPI